MKQEKKRVVVFSGVNLVEGGPLSIMKDAVNAFIKTYNNEFELVLIINDKSFFKEIKDVETREFKYPKRRWLYRLWFEYIHSYFISKKLDVYLWFGMHDVTSNVRALRKVVYCHNPAPFYKLSFKDLYLDKALIFFRYFYMLFYRINIYQNNHVIVQQDWIRNRMKEVFKLDNIIVAHPDITLPATFSHSMKNSGKKIFFYPGFPRVFKNFEVLCKAAENLARIYNDFEVKITIDGDENRYAAKLFKKYKHVKQIKFIGVQSRENLWGLYEECDCLVFASKMETWGLPLTEIKAFSKPVLVADLNYAIETIGEYEKVCFFEPDDYLGLQELMKDVIADSLSFKLKKYTNPAMPFAKNWNELFKFILA